jgi:outer membrane lipoprotein-sorting protein
MRLILPLLLTFVAHATLVAADLPTVVAKMNTAAAQYKGMTAKIRSVKYTRLVDDKNTESGEIWVQRDPKGQVTLRISITEPSRRQVRVEGTKVEIYREGINQIEEMDLKSKREQLEEALLIGFGASGDYLQARYNIVLGGGETLEDEATVKLMLTPKDEEARAKGQTLEMWVSTTTWQPIQQKLNESDGDYQLYYYGDATINPGIKDSDLKLDVAPGKKPKRVKQSL